MSSYITLIIGWVIYLAFHSVLAADVVRNTFPLKAQAYRLLYSVVSTLGLMVLVYLMAIAKSHYFFEPIFVTKYAGMALGVWGVVIMVAAFREISLKSFLGLSSEENSGLVTTGIHAKVRHPIYSGGLLILVGMFVSVPSSSVLIATLCIAAYLPVGIYFEEKKLIKEFGEDYLNYREEVKAIIPGVI